MNYSRFDNITDSDSEEEREQKRSATSNSGGKPEKGDAKQSSTSVATSASLRQCRCMFCGEAMQLDSEEAAVEHMAVCPALKEQLDSKDQFHIPNELQQKLNLKPNK